MTEDSNRRVRTSITIKPELLDMARVVSAKRGVSVSRFIEEALSAQFEPSEQLFSDKKAE